MLKHPILPLVRRSALAGSALMICLASVSCKLPPRQAWNSIQQRGLIPVLFPANAAEGADPAPAGSTAIAQSGTEALKVQAVKTPELASTPFATPVPGRSGYVFSPHSAGHKLIDVREYAAGAEARCPYTMQPFMVPDFAALAAAAKTKPAPRPQRSIAEVVSRNPEPRLRDETVDVAPLLPTNTIVNIPSTPATEIPYGSRVEGRPGFVNSPFAQKNQLVDVAGIAPGVEERCPYSNKLFRVPEPLPEETTPEPATVIPPAPASPPAPPEPQAPATPAPEATLAPDANPAPAANPEPAPAPAPSVPPAAAAAPDPAVTPPSGS